MSLLPPLITGLLKPQAYPHPTGAIKLVETHISWVLLTGDYVYKIKKPVNLGFLDFSTPERRRACCTEEVRLNGRFAPELYLGTVPVTGTAAQPQMSGAGEPIEWAVKLRQFDDASQLDRLLEAGKLTAADCERLAAEIAAVEDRLAVADAEQPWGSPDLFLETVGLNLDQLVAARPVVAARGDQLRQWFHGEVDKRHNVLQARRATGKVRECHGDLHLANIVMHEGRPLAFDGIEFNESLRWIDVASDIAFLVMDLHARGRADLASRVTSAWMEAANDHAAAAVLPLYTVYRAVVRAAVAAIRQQQAEQGGDAPVARAMAAESDRYLDLAEQLAAPRPPRLFVTSGISGSGKTTVAGQVIDAEGAIRIRSDVERKRLAGLSPTERPSGEMAVEDLYSETMTNRVYRRLAERAAALLEAGQTVVIDATCLRRAHRQVFTELAAAKQVPLVWLACELSLEEAERRIAARQAAGDDASDASAAVARRQHDLAEPIAAAECAGGLGSQIVRIRSEAMNRDSLRKLVASLCLLAALLLSRGGRLHAADPSAAEQPPRACRVLVIDQEVPTRPAFVSFMEGFRQTLAADPNGGYEVFVENLDLVRLGRDESDPERAAGWLLEKYSDAPFDAIVPTSRVTRDFVLASRPELAPGAAIVSVNRPGEPLLDAPLPPRYTYAAPKSAATETVALAHRLFPASQRVAVVGQSLPHPRFIAAQLAECQAVAAEQALAFVPLVDLPLAELRSRLRALPVESIVIYIGYWKDTASGTTYVPATILETLCRDTKAPVFGVADTYVGRGIVGGACIDTKLLGSAAARQVVASRKDQPLEPQLVPPVPILDQRVLTRFGIPAGRLPAGSTILFREPGFWDRYWPQAIGAGSLLLLQAVLITALIEQLRRRRRAERLVDEQRDLIAHAGRISTLGQFAASLAHELGQPLGAMFNNIEAAQLLIDGDDSPRATELRQILADLAADDQRAGEVLDGLRAMVRRQSFSRGPVVVAEVIRGTLALAGPRLAAAGIQVITDCQATLPRVAGDQVLLQQALLNLVGNAADAIEARLAAAAAAHDSRPEPGKIVLQGRDGGGTIELAVIDNGGGLKPAELDRALTTFWTTKPAGLGMGLPIVQSILEQHEGTLSVQNSPSQGLTVRLCLPAWEEGRADACHGSSD